MDTILVVNAGSSSLKFQLFAISDDNALVAQIKGQVDGIGTRPLMRVKSVSGDTLFEKQFTPENVSDTGKAIQITAEWLKAEVRGYPIAVGHRVVHGGTAYRSPMLVDTDVVNRLESFSPLAPLHQPYNLRPIKSILERLPNVPQVACFDTAFHATHSSIVDHYALPERFYQAGVRRFGFHGLSYEFVAHRMREIAPAVARTKMIVAHLGSGASMCAIENGRSVASTLGFTALDGLAMGTRPGQLDPGIVLFLITEMGMTPVEVQTLLYHECGLRGLSGQSSDVRILLDSSDSRSRFALDYFVEQIGLYGGYLAAAMGGVDAFVFTAGIGENSPEMRRRIVAKFNWLGASLEEEKNVNLEGVISAASSRLPVYIVPTNEELMVARHTYNLLFHPAG